jgi:hypothetical protein
MRVKEAAMQAYPFIEPQPDENIKAYHPGMELRDYFAAMAMQGVLSGTLTPDAIWSNDEVAKTAYNVADAMMKARKT